MRILGKNVSSPFLLLGVTEFIGGALAFLAACWIVIGFIWDGSFVASLPLGAWTLAFGLSVVVGMIAMGLYHPKQRLRIEGIIARQSVGLIIAGVLLALMNFFIQADLPRSVWLLSIALTVPILIASRAGFKAIADRDTFRRRVLVLGAGERASRILRLRRRSDRRGFRVVGFMPAPGDKFVIDHARVTDQSNLLAYASEHRVNEIVVALDERRQHLPILELLECRFAGIEVIELLGFLERETGRVPIDIVTPDWLIFSGGFKTNAARDAVLRLFDLIAVLSTMLVTLPVMVLTALAVLLGGDGPVVYRQKRVGLNGRVFDLYKFRSMVTHAESDGQPQWATDNDPRLTRVGAFLRKYRLDELPQVFNVLKGDMSLVGPRPERPQFVAELSEQVPYYSERHCVKPGLTGWAQTSYPYGSSRSDAMEKLAFDLFYVKHRSLVFNLVILLQTAEVVLWSKGAR